MYTHQYHVADAKSDWFWKGEERSGKEQRSWIMSPPQCLPKWAELYVWSPTATLPVRLVGRDVARIWPGVQTGPERRNLSRDKATLVESHDPARRAQQVSAAGVWQGSGQIGRNLSKLFGKGNLRK